ncbi:unnamed protein product [Rotaria sordida]|uniref:VWFA domain-containing protein n=4 Tax=Rotaria sordida TaxID=392033 RepID=A0A814EJF1_9BILA|nr:unnamed protein product [Rotaria sordida]
MMSRSTFLTTSTSPFDASETPSHPTTTNATTDRTSTLRFHHRLMPTISTNGRSHETVPIVFVQSATTSNDSLTTPTTTTTTAQHKSVVRLNPKLKRNLRDTRRSTGIQPDEVSLANATNDTPLNADDEEEDKVGACSQFLTIPGNESIESYDHNRTSPPKPVFKVSRLQPTFEENSRHSFEKLSISRADPFVMTSSPSPSPSPSNTFSNTSSIIFRPEEFILRRQPSDEDPPTVKRRQLDERVCILESLVRDKDSIILDLQRQLERVTRDLKDAEQQMYVLQRDKLTLIKTLTKLQDPKSSSGGGGGGGDRPTSPKRTGFITRSIFSTNNLCRLIEFNIPEGLFSFHTNDIEEKLFYKTDYVCQNKPIFRSIKYQNLYQFQSPNNRWWILYDTKNSTYKLGTYEWCNAWNAKPLLAMPLGMFQNPLGKQIKLQRWKHVIVHEKNNSYTYKSVSNVYLKCYYPSSTSHCQTNQLAFLFDLTETTNKDEFNQMKLLTKTLIWLLYNQTNISLSYYSDTFHIINTFDKKTSIKSLEHLYDSIDTIDKHNENSKQFFVSWPETIHNIVTKIFKRRFLLPLNIINTTDEYQSLKTNNSTNDDDDEIYTEPYPLIYSDEDAIKTILNITTYSYRKKRSLKKSYNKLNHVLVILTSRSKYLYDYKQQDKQLAKFIATVPLRIVVIDFNKISNQNLAQYIHSAFIHYAKYALVSSPINYNYIETYEELGDVIHGNQLFNYYHRLCYPPEENLFKNNFRTTLIETYDSSTMECTLLTLFNNKNNNSTLKKKFDYTFYETPDRCFSAPVYRSLGDRNLYIQKISNGHWLIIRVDPLLPSTMSIQQKFASTTTSTLEPEFFYATDYANGPIIDNYNNVTTIIDLPISVPHCSDTPGLDIIWESVDNQIFNDYSLHTPRQWISNLNKSDLISPICNKYKISCQTTKFDLLILIDSHNEYLLLIKTFLNIFFTLIEPYYHRFSLIILTSSTIDTFQYHIPLTSINTIYNNKNLIENFLSYIDDRNISLIQLNQHLERISNYLINNQEFLSNISTQQIILTISSRLNFNQTHIKEIIQRYTTIRYMVLDPYLKNDDYKHHNNQEREKFLSLLTSKPSYINLFSSYAAYRDLTFHTVFRLLESLCGYLQ